MLRITHRQRWWGYVILQQVDDHAVQEFSDLGGYRSSKSGELCGGGDAGTVETFHVFGVFDGHGGHRAAEHCANKLTQNLKMTITRALKKYALPIQEIVRFVYNDICVT